MGVKIFRGWIRPGPEAFSGFGSDPDPDPSGSGRTREYPDPDPNPSGSGWTRVSTWELVLDCWFARYVSRVVTQQRS